MATFVASHHGLIFPVRPCQSFSIVLGLKAVLQEVDVVFPFLPDFVDISRLVCRLGVLPSCANDPRVPLVASLIMITDVQCKLGAVRFLIL